MGSANTTSSRRSSAIIQLTSKSGPLIRRRKTEGNLCVCVTIGFGFTFDWTTKQRQLFQFFKTKVNANDFRLIGGNLFKMRSVVFDFNIT